MADLWNDPEFSSDVLKWCALAMEWNRNKRRQRRWWVRPINDNRSDQGDFDTRRIYHLSRSPAIETSPPSVSTSLSPGSSRPASCFTPTPAKRRLESESDDLGWNLLTISARICDKMNSSQDETAQLKAEAKKDVLDQFGAWVVAELKNMPPEIQNKKKKQMMDILMAEPH